MKSPVSNALSVVALATSFALFSPDAAEASLLCQAGSGNTVGTFTCTETVTFGPQPTDFSNAALAFDRFTSGAAAGFTETLTSVAFSFGGTAVASGTLTNNAPSAQTFSFLETETLSFAGGLGAPFVGSATASGNLVSIGPVTLAPGASLPINGSLSLSPSTFSTTNVAGYTGAGTFQILSSSLTSESFSGGGGNIQQALATFATPAGTLTYTFQTARAVSPVPEPETYALMLTGLAAIGYIGGRRKLVK